MAERLGVWTNGKFISAKNKGAVRAVKAARRRAAKARGRAAKARGRAAKAR